MKLKSLNKLTAVLLSILMIIVFMPSMAFADDSVSTTTAGFLSGLKICSDYNGKASYEMSPKFSADEHNYTIKTKDSDYYTKVYPELSEAGKGATITAKWKDVSTGKDRTQSVSTSGQYLMSVITTGCEAGRPITLEVKKGDETQDYKITTSTERTLSGMSLEVNGDSTYKYTPKFNRDTKEYSATVLKSAKSIKITPETVNSETYGKDYSIKVNGKEMTGNSAEVALDDNDEQVIPVTVSAKTSEGNTSNTYNLTVKKVNAVKLTLNTDPKDAIIYITDSDSKRVQPEADGTYDLLPGVAYSYTVTKTGYVGQSGDINITENTARDVTLKKADANSEIDASTVSQWKNFRGDDSNMAIVDYKTPTSNATTEFRWAKKLGTGWGAAPCIQIIVEGNIVTISGKKIYMLDSKTGEIIKEGDLVGSTNWGYTPMTYANGMIFCPLANGTIQAVNAKTFKSLWVYQDPLKGQSLSPITYSDGYIYTGFWNSETKDANYVCLSTTDEDPTQTNEAKTASWRYKTAGGFYWAGSVVVGNAVIFGTDDGESGNTSPTSKLISMDKTTGKIISELPLIGDQRSTIAYDKSSGRIYGTTKSGYLFTAAIDTTTGKLTDFKQQQYASTAGAGMSTSTPVVYKGVVYIGYVEGGNFGGKNYMLAADANTLKENWRVGLKGYPQCSMLLSTAYEKTDGNIYLYSTYNSMPGGITLVKAKPDCTDSSQVKVEEAYDAEDYSQYCITSIIADSDGNLYYKNDSCNIISVGTNNAYLDKMTVSGGNPVWDNEFSSARTSYDVAVDPGTKSVDLGLTGSEDSNVTVDDKAVTDGRATAALTEGKATVTVKVTKGEKSKTYTVNIREKSQDATLKEIKVNESNSYSGAAKTLTPDFASDTTDYAVYGASSNRYFENLWPDVNDSKAACKVYAVSGVAEGEYDATTGEIELTAANSGHKRYAIYFNDDTAVVRVRVTSESGATKDYRVVITKKASDADTLAALKTQASDLENSFDIDAYRPAERLKLKKAKAALEKAIAAATTSSEAAKAIDEFSTTAGVLKTDDDYTQELNDNRTAAATAIDVAATADTHNASEQAQIDEIVSAAKLQIKALTEKEDMDAVVTKAKMDIAYVVVLNKAKAAAINQINTAAKVNQHGTSEQAEIDIVVNAAISQVNNSLNADGLNAIVAKVKQDISKIEKSYIPTQPTTGGSDAVKLMAPALGVKSEKENVTLTWGKIKGATDYTVYYRVSGAAAWTEMNTTDITVEFTELKADTTYEFKVTANVTSGKVVVSSEDSNTVSVATPSSYDTAKPGKVTSLKVNAKNTGHKCTASWKKVLGAKGYQVQYKKSANKKAKYKTLKTLTKNKFTTQKLKRGTKYSFRVRAYKVVDGKKIYGSWSKPATVKCK